MRVFHFLPQEYGLQALQNQRLKIARINELNDPFELLAADLSNKGERQRFLEWKKETSQKIGFLCFSKNKKNPLLWSHYAEKHRGVAVELEVADELIVPVRYRHSRLRLDLPKIKARGGFSASLAEQLGSTKSIDWKYEEEVRVPINLSSCQTEENLLFETMGNGLNIVSITAGPLCELDQREIQYRLPFGTQIMLHYSRIAFRSFNVVANKAKRSVLIKANG